MMSILRRVGGPAVAVFLAFLALSPAPFLHSQEGPTVNQSDGPPGRAYTKRPFYDGSGRLEYVCHAEANSRQWQFTVSAATNATPIVVTLGGEEHGLYAGALVTITQAQGNTAANGTWQVTTPSATTLGLLNRVTKANSVGNGTYAASSGLLTTNAPRLNQAQWSIQKLVYNVSGQLEFSGWVEGSSNVTGGKICDNRANYGAQ